MKAVRMTTLDCQRQNLENEIIRTKEQIWAIKEADHPDIASISQLKDKIERNMQLINMIDQHLYTSARERAHMS